jgi:ankyrin repeat protein
MSDLQNLIEAVKHGHVEHARSILESDPGLAKQKDESGATALHYAALHGHRPIVDLLLERGADINSTDSQFGATPAGWAIEYLREKGGYLAIELDDFGYAIQMGDIRWVKRFLKRFPALRKTSDTTGAPFRTLAQEYGNRAIAGLFDAEDLP